jgi:uncharacterized protein (DUF302 family)
MRTLYALLLGLLLTLPAAAGPPTQQSLSTAKPFWTLAEDLKQAISRHGMLLVTQACASCGAKARGITVPGNLVFGVFRNDFALRMLEADISAGIEAPVRFYLIERADGMSTLSWKTPSSVFAPYGNAALDEMGLELDGIFASIAADAVK